MKTSRRGDLQRVLTSGACAQCFAFQFDRRPNAVSSRQLRPTEDSSLACQFSRVLRRCAALAGQLADQPIAVADFGGR